MTEDAQQPAACDHGTADWYHARRQRFAADRAAVQRRWNVVANLRLVGFVLLGGALWQALFVGPVSWWAAVAVALVGVVGLVSYHVRLRGERDRLGLLVAVNDAALARLALRWDDAPMPPVVAVRADHPYARDLDVVGRASLLHRIGTPATAPGWQTLSDWLLAPAIADEIAARQPAVGELAGMLDLRQAVEAAGRSRGEEADDPAALLHWAEGQGWLRARRWLLVVGWLGPVALVLLAVAQAAGIVSMPLWLFPLMVNIAVAQGLGRGASEEVAAIAPVHRAISVYRETIERVGDLSPRAPRLVAIRDELADAAAGVRRLERLSARSLPVEGLLAFLVQAVTLWDIHLLAALERWQVEYGSRVRRWVALVGEVEALSALSALAHDHPDWTFPSVDVNADRVEAEALGHPLIRSEEVVRNDVVLGPPGSFLFVTGSNMSGKSTLLRAIGANIVLAGAGGPVCSSVMTLPPVALWTAMRVEDSLERGVSYFLAELERLKQVVDAARSGAGEPPLCYLLDEILQGTNTVERQIAARRVIGLLLACGAIGAVSSHDLALADAEPLQSAAHTVHFAERFTGTANSRQMTFDYVLRDGIATSTNALALMELIGLTEGLRTED